MGVNVRIVEAVKVAAGRLRTTSIVIGFVVAIVRGCSWQDGWRSVSRYSLRVDGTLRLDFEMTSYDWPKVESFVIRHHFVFFCKIVHKTKYRAPKTILYYKPDSYQSNYYSQ